MVVLPVVVAGASETVVRITRVVVGQEVGVGWDAATRAEALGHVREMACLRRTPCQPELDVDVEARPAFQIGLMSVKRHRRSLCVGRLEVQTTSCRRVDDEVTTSR